MKIHRVSKRANQGFTLVELLVVISIIAVLAVVGELSYGNAQRSARDSKRTTDLQSIATQLYVYYQKNGSYPPGSNTSPQGLRFSYTDDPDPAHNPPIYGLDTTYFAKIPTDPTPIGPTPGGHHYFYIPTGDSCSTPQGFYMIDYLENSNLSNYSKFAPLVGCENHTPTLVQTQYIYVIQNPQ